MSIINYNKKIRTHSGFTLVELLVSIALFSVVLTVVLGSIMTIVDSNRKARSLMSVTNNLNFAVDAMVRSFKSGEASNSFINNPGCFDTTEINYKGGGNFDRRKVEYCFVEEDELGKITKKVGANGTAVDLTGLDVDIDNVEFKDISVGGNGANKQPMLGIVMYGTVRVSPNISSDFSIQTNVSQRKLNVQ